ncbi:hypothetical protein D3C80_1122400 [compost metagenome]
MPEARAAADRLIIDADSASKTHDQKPAPLLLKFSEFFAHDLPWSVQADARPAAHQIAVQF